MSPMIPRNKPVLYLFVLTASITSLGHGVEKTPVAVSFRLTEPDYRKECTAAEITALETRLSAKLADLFNENVGFLAFDVQAQAPYSLTIALGRKAPDAIGPYWEVGFKAKIEGPGIRHTDGYWQKYCSEESYEASREDANGLEGSVGLKLDGLTDSAYEALVSEFLCQVPICEDGAQLLSDPLGWILPHRRHDLRMDGDSLVSVENLLPTNIGLFAWRFSGIVKRPELPSDPAYFEQTICMATSGETELDKLRDAPADEIQVRKIYVKRYFRFDVDLEGSQSPGEVGFNQ